MLQKKSKHNTVNNKDDSVCGDSASTAEQVSAAGDLINSDEVNVQHNEEAETQSAENCDLNIDLENCTTTTTIIEDSCNSEEELVVVEHLVSSNDSEVLRFNEAFSISEKTADKVEKAKVQEIKAENSCKPEKEPEIVEHNVSETNEPEIQRFNEAVSICEKTTDKVEKATKVQEIRDITALKSTEAKEHSKDTVLSNVIAYTETQLAALYRNSELEMLEDFVLQYVEAELKGTAVKQHPLYELLLNYLQAREKITGNTLELNQLRKEYSDSKSGLWSIAEHTMAISGECQDGVRLTARHVYNKATFHRSVFQTVVRMLANIRKLINENHVYYAYSAKFFKLQVSFCLFCTG